MNPTRESFQTHNVKHTTLGLQPYPSTRLNELDTLTLVGVHSLANLALNSYPKLPLSTTKPSLLL